MRGERFPLSGVPANVEAGRPVADARLASTLGHA